MADIEPEISEFLDTFDEDRKQNKYLIPNIARALKVLEYLAREKKEATIADITKTLNYPKNSVFRVLKSLEFYGYVEETDRRYHATPRLLYLGYAGMRNKGLVENAIDIMHVLRDEINETVLLGTLLGNKVVIIEQLISFQHIKFTAEIGMNVSIQTSAPGKAIIAHLPDDEIKKILDQITFVRYTDNTVPSKKAMFDEMQKVRALGYAVDDGEEIKEVHCIGVPIFDYRHYPIAAIWVVGPENRLTNDLYPEVGKIVREYALKISKRFGYDPV